MPKKATRIGVVPPAVQPLNGRLIFERLAVWLKRYPDTKNSEFDSTRLGLDMTGKVAVKENTMLYTGKTRETVQRNWPASVHISLRSIKIDWRLTKTKPIICE
jgi:hypothetical protein